MSIRWMILFCFAVGVYADEVPGVIDLPGGKGPGAGRHVVLLGGDEEYRSEEALPMLAQILSTRHGFHCTVLLPVNKQGQVAPDNLESLPGSESLDSADAIVMLLRFRNWPDSDMARFDAALKRGVPVIALRTSTHAFNIPKGRAFDRYSFNSREWPGGFGKQILGETWVSHHGHHRVEGTRGILEPGMENHPVLTDVHGIFGNSDVYTANPPADAQILLRGEVTTSLDPNSSAVPGSKNHPMQPIVWTRSYKQENGKTNTILCSTIGAASDLVNPGLRRMIVNAVYWVQGMPVPANAEADPVGEYRPTMYGFNTFKKGLPADAFLPVLSKDTTEPSE